MSKVRLYTSEDTMVELRCRPLSVLDYLTRPDTNRKLIRLKPRQILFSQGGIAKSVFYILQGHAKLTVVSSSGKEGTITFLIAGDFVGEESIATVEAHRTATARTLSECSVLEIGRREMLRLIHEEQSFSDMFISFLVARGIRTQADLADKLFHSSEERLARILLLNAEFDKSGESGALMPNITQETLAEMVGTTRPRINFFMRRFCELGFIKRNGAIVVHRSITQVFRPE